MVSNVTLDNPLKMKIKASAWASDPQKSNNYDIKINIDLEHRKEILRQYPEQIKAPGLKAIKKIELNKKWNPLIQAEFKGGVLYQNANEEEWKTFKESKSKKSKLSTKKKRKIESGMI